MILCSVKMEACNNHDETGIKVTFFSFFYDLIMFYHIGLLRTILFYSFYRILRSIVWYCYGKVCSSVTLAYCDHTGWNSSKIISPLLSLGCSLSADHNFTDLLQQEHPEILTGIGEGYRKSSFRCTKALFLKRGKIGPRLLLRTNRIHTFDWCKKSMTSDDL